MSTSRPCSRNCWAVYERSSRYWLKTGCVLHFIGARRATANTLIAFGSRTPQASRRRQNKPFSRLIPTTPMILFTSPTSIWSTRSRTVRSRFARNVEAEAVPHRQETQVRQHLLEVIEREPQRTEIVVPLQLVDLRLV